MHVQTYKPLDEAEYLALEARSPVRHEYIAGEVFAMTGARRNHVTVTVNLTSALRNLVRGTPCRVYASDMKLRIASADAACYPDVSVRSEEHTSELQSQR